MTPSQMVVIVMVICLTIPPSSLAFNVLLFPVFIPTRQVLYESLESQLRQAGHNVSYLIYEDDIGSAQQLSQAFIIEARGLDTTELELQEWEMKAMASWTEPIASFQVPYLNALARRCDLLLQNEELLTKLIQGKLDLILFDLWGNDLCGMTLGRKLNVLVGGVQPSLTEPFSYYTVAPSPFLQSLETNTRNPSFAERATSLYFYYKRIRFWENSYFQEAFGVVHKHLPKYQEVSDVYRDVAVIFIDSFTPFDSPSISLPANVFFIGGIHCRVPSLLPKVERMKLYFFVCILYYCSSLIPISTIRTWTTLHGPTVPESFLCLL